MNSPAAARWLPVGSPSSVHPCRFSSIPRGLQLQSLEALLSPRVKIPAHRPVGQACPLSDLFPELDALLALLARKQQGVMSSSFSSALRSAAGGRGFFTGVCLLFPGWRTFGSAPAALPPFLKQRVLPEERVQHPTRCHPDRPEPLVQQLPDPRVPGFPLVQRTAFRTTVWQPALQRAFDTLRLVMLVWQHERLQLPVQFHALPTLQPPDPVPHLLAGFCPDILLDAVAHLQRPARTGGSRGLPLPARKIPAATLDPLLLPC